jgi:hypothetical protein
MVLIISIFSYFSILFGFIIPFKRHIIPMLLIIYAGHLTFLESPGGIDLFIILAMLSVPYFLLSNGDIFKEKKFDNTLLILFIVLLWFIAFYRGVGIQSLGGQGVGGARYFVITLWLGFLIVCQKINMPYRMLRKTLILICMFAIVSLIIDTGTSLNIIPQGGFLDSIIKDLRPKEAYAKFSSLLSGRIFTFNQLALWVLVFGLLVTSKKRKIQDRVSYIILWFLFSNILAVFSGHRITIITNIVILIFYFGLDKVINRRMKISMFIIIITAIIILFVGAVTIADHFPVTVQRSLSWLPGIENESASTTRSWRLEVWRLAFFNELPQYLWIGKGFTVGYFNFANIIAKDIYLGVIDSNNYHNGPLSLIIIFGIPGFLLIIAFFISTLVYHLKYYKHLNRQSEFISLYQIILCWFAAELLIYLLIYGDIAFSFIRIFFLISLLNIINCSIKSNKMNTKDFAGKTAIQN